MNQLKPNSAVCAKFTRFVTENLAYLRAHELEFIVVWLDNDSNQDLFHALDKSSIAGFAVPQLLFALLLFREVVQDQDDRSTGFCVIGKRDHERKLRAVLSNTLTVLSGNGLGRQALS